MNGLVIDTSKGLKACLIDLEQNVLKSINVDDVKLSKTFHAEIDSLILKHIKTWDNLNYFFYNLGPGSYTGLKFTHSLAESILLKETINVGGFYLFDIPQMLNIEKGVWVDRAFKGEVFVYEWDQEQSNQYLVKETDFFFSEHKTYFARNKEIFNNANITSTDDMFLNHGRDIFEYLVKQPLVQKDIFYYRSIDKEYQKS